MISEENNENLKVEGQVNQGQTFRKTDFNSTWDKFSLFPLPTTSLHAPASSTEDWQVFNA